MMITRNQTLLPKKQGQHAQVLETRRNNTPTVEVGALRCWCKKVHTVE